MPPPLNRHSQSYRSVVGVPDEFATFRPPTPPFDPTADTEMSDSTNLPHLEMTAAPTGRRRRLRDASWRPPPPNIGLQTFAEQNSLEKALYENAQTRSYKEQLNASNVIEKKRKKLEAERRKADAISNQGVFPYLLPAKDFRFNNGSVPMKLQKHFNKLERRYLMKDQDIKAISAAEVLEKFHDFVVGNLQRLKQVFTQLDGDGDGVLRIDEFEDGLRKLGLDMSLMEIKLLIADINQDGDNEVSFEELQGYMEKINKQKRKALKRKNIKSIPQYFWSPQERSFSDQMLSSFRTPEIIID